MELESAAGLMVNFMLDNGHMEFDKGKEYGNQKIRLKVIQDNGKMGKFAGMANI